MPWLVRPPTKVVAFQWPWGTDRAIDPLAARATAIVPRHVGGGAGLVDEHQPLWVQRALSGPPRSALFGKLGPVLLFGPERLFFSVSPSRASVRCIRPRLAVTPWVASSQARSSSKVMSEQDASSAAIAACMPLSLSVWWLRCGRASTSPVAARRPSAL